MRDSFPYVIVIGICCFIIVLIWKVEEPSHPTIEKVKYCKIDSISTSPKNEFSPEILTKYHTECDITFSSNKEYHIGDSIKVKTIIIQ